MENRIAQWVIDIAPYAVAILALGGVIYQSRLSDRRQSKAIRATVRADKRQAWINSIRDDLAEFLAMKDIDDRHANSDGLNAKIIEEGEAARRRMYLLHQRIQLKLNPTEDAHIIFERKLKEVRLAQSSSHAQIDELVSLGQGIFKTEWEVIKRGE